MQTFTPWTTSCPAAGELSWARAASAPHSRPPRLTWLRRRLVVGGDSEGPQGLRRLVPGACCPSLPHTPWLLAWSRLGMGPLPLLGRCCLRSACTALYSLSPTLAHSDTVFDERVRDSALSLLSPRELQSKLQGTCKVLLQECKLEEFEGFLIMTSDQ